MVIPDKATRDAIRTEKNRSVVVEASAGTGKTTLITHRVKELVDSGIPLEKLAIVTFTRAAASELRTRIREKLTPEQRRTMDQAWITTIDGFASRILREYFHLCNSAPEFTMETGHFSRSEIAILWDLFLANAEPSVLRASAESLKNPGSSRLLEIAAGIEEFRWFSSSSPLGDTRAKLEESRSLWKKRLDSLVPLCSDPEDKLLKNIISARGSLRSEVPQKVKRSGGSEKNWGGRESFKEVKAVLKKYNDEGLKLILSYLVMIPLLPSLDKLVIPFVNKLRATWDSDPTRLSFNDLLYKAMQAVSSSAELRHELNERFCHIFIDEFQDTSLVQVKLFSTLLGQSGLQEKLTVVGDPKQSIFGWRSADIETYKDTLSQLENVHALSETIVVNFRSEISIINFVNALGSALFTGVPLEEEPFSCSYSEIKPRPDATAGEAVTVFRLPDVSASEMADIEADRITELIEDPASTAILFRTKTHLDSLVQALDRKGIPYKVEASRDFHKRSEVRDTANLLRAVLCPSDKMALTRTFRSIFFGINDRDITLYRLKSSPDTIIAAEKLLDKLRKISLLLPPGPFIETLFQNTCLLSAVRESGYQVSRRLGNLKFILETAHNTTDYALLLETLTGEAPMSSEEPSAPPETRSGVVTLSTIHRAKGLAWRHVILVNPGNSFKNTPPPVLANARELTAGIKMAGGLTANFYDLAAREKARSRAEYRRLLYVAVTRPRVKLDIFLPEKTKAGSPANILNNALSAAAGFFEEEAVSCKSPDHDAFRQEKSARINHGRADDFNQFYPDHLPPVQSEKEKQMQIGTEVHAILEFIDFNKPELWLKKNSEQLHHALEFPDHAISLATRFFKIFNLENAQVIGKEYPLLVGGKQYYIDLLLQRNGIYEIVDYKTDREDAEKKAEDYRPKQLLYAEALRNITGKKVKARLAFLHHGVIIDL